MPVVQQNFTKNNVIPLSKASTTKFLQKQNLCKKTTKKTDRITNREIVLYLNMRKMKQLETYLSQKYNQGR